MAKLAEELNAWFARAATPDRQGRSKEPSTADVADVISKDPAHDVTISRSYLGALRSGAQTNPTIAVVEALVGYFRPLLTPLGVVVSVSALVGDESPVVDSAGHGELGADTTQWNKLLADRQIQSIAMRAGTMTPALRHQVLKMMDVLDPPPAD